MLDGFVLFLAETTYETQKGSERKGPRKRKGKKQEESSEQVIAK